LPLAVLTSIRARVQTVYAVMRASYASDGSDEQLDRLDHGEGLQSLFGLDTAWQPPVTQTVKVSLSWLRARSGTLTCLCASRA
jgi:hypothetical protein